MQCPQQGVREHFLIVVVAVVDGCYDVSVHFSKRKEHS